MNNEQICLIVASFLTIAAIGIAIGICVAYKKNENFTDYPRPQGHLENFQYGISNKYRDYLTDLYNKVL